jgi:hypothetical protein
MISNTESSRRDFLRLASAGTAASLAGLAWSESTRSAAGEEPAGRKSQRPLQLALASYTLRNFDLDQTLQMTRRVGLDAVCLKSMHLPLDASREILSAAAKKVVDAGLLLYGGGVIYMNNEQEVEQAFAYAKAAGMTKIIGVPAPALLPLVHDKVQQFDIEVCIHNHGPGDDDYPTPDRVYEKIQTLDKRIGLCHDVGHTVRMGQDPVAASEQCADRLLDVHMKDVTEPTAQGHAIACGRGVIDIPALLRCFVKIGYRGFLSFEYEEQPDDPLPGLAESVGYVRGALDMLS